MSAKHLPTTLRRDIPYVVATQRLGSFLVDDRNVCILKVSRVGMFLYNHMSLKILCKCLVMTSPQLFSVSGGMPSGPGLLLHFVLLIDSTTSALVGSIPRL